VSGSGTDRPTIAVTMGDPAGIGPEVLLRSISSGRAAGRSELAVVGSARAMSAWAERLDLELPSEIIDVGDAPAEPGRPTAEGARAAVESVRRAVNMCLTGDAHAVVTAPVSKAAISSLGEEFVGHTEYLARLTGCEDYVMTFVHGDHRIGLATAHMALRDVPVALTPALILSKLRALDRGLRTWFGVADPVIAVMALNPHSGEGGRFGDEEEVVIGPALSEAARMGIDARGPYSADAIFAVRGDSGGSVPSYDAALAMYHDQGTIASKLIAGGAGVNVTVGLPIVRTSVDHGTAFDIAGSGRADHRSMSAAIALATEIAMRLGTG